MTTENKAQANSDPVLRELDTLLAAQGKLQFAREDYNEEAATVFGVALLDFMRVHGMEVRRRIATALTSPQADKARGEVWTSVADRLPDDGVLVLVYAPDTGDGDRIDFDGCDEGRWVEHDNSREHFVMVGGDAAAGADCTCTGPAEEAPYTHWMPIPANPSAAPQPQGDASPHPDDEAVDLFAAAMKKKLAEARAKGRGGWDGSEDLQQRLSDMLRDHVAKGDPRDVANFACFLWNRGERITPEQPQGDGFTAADMMDARAEERSRLSTPQARPDGGAVAVAGELVAALIDISEHGIDKDGDRNFTAEGHKKCVGLAYAAIEQNEWFFGGRPKPAPAPDVARLVEAWEARARSAHPSDAMLINKHIRELREALATQPPARKVEA